MKQSLQLKLSQTMTMTPQLQQAIRLLQLSTLELQHEIQQALESNLMLEVDSDSNNTHERENGQAASTLDASLSSSINSTDKQHEATRDTASTEHGDLDGDTFLTRNTDPEPDHGDGWGSSGPARSFSDDSDFERDGAMPTSLKAHLAEQLALRALSERDRLIAELVIDAVNDDGYLDTPPEDLRLALPADLGVDIDEIEAVRHLIQHLDPLGAASLDLRDALLVQLKALPPDTRYRDVAIDVIERHIALLGSSQWGLIERKLGLDSGDLKQAMALIRTCHPRPGATISTARTEYITPDVHVRKHNGRWLVELNSEVAPRIRVNNYYASLIRRADNSAENTTLRQHLQEARWLIKSLRSRNETLLKVANCIIEHQHDYFEHGEEAMKPLILKHVADEVGMHESTISRVTTQKYMSTPRGIREFKYFFSSHVGTAAGEECSATAIRARIRRLVADEDATRPFSDNHLTKILNQEGINIARRTVAKYRESMQIGSSTERRRMP